MKSGVALETSKEMASRVAEYAHGRVPRELRKKQVLAVAKELFADRGFRNASMDELARRVGVSKPVVYDLVGSKEQLFRLIVGAEAAELAERVELAVNAEPDPTERLRAGSLAYFRFVGERHATWQSLMAQGEALMADELAAARRFHARSVAALMARGAETSGAEVDSATIDLLAHAVNALSEGVANWWQEHPEWSAETLADLVTRLVGPGLSAFGAPSTKDENR